MALVLTEEQELLKESAVDYLNDKSPVTHLRELRDNDDEVGFSRAIWKEMAQLGWAGIIFPEEHGGADMGYAELGILLEESGRRLAPYPLLSTVVLGGGSLMAGGNEEQQKKILPGVCSGDTLLALASQEQGRFAPYTCKTTAAAVGDGYTLNGSKTFVLDGHVADHLIVVARTSGATSDRDGLTLFLVAGDATGVKTTRTKMVDSRNAAQIAFENVSVSASDVVGTVDAGADVLDAVFDRATAAISAELLGISSEVFERTLVYLKTREQFGTLIGTFQALKHRAADMFCEIELSKSVVLDALRAIDAGRDDTSRVVSAAKARTSDTAGQVTREGVQMHGGIGMTDEEEIGLFLKRAKAAELTFGDGGYHRDRFAALLGF
ncbi:MAG: alkylation response protein AidB-like acyl-CoA dehydrogenase [Myxococcota bacterium]|jgi:alkylation response protein AidB-like acyl-CoA dehydrogenase